MQVFSLHDSTHLNFQRSAVTYSDGKNDFADFFENQPHKSK